MRFLLLHILFFSGFVVFAQKDTIKIDFGTITSPFPWNNVVNPTAGYVPNLINEKGFSTGVSIAVSEPFAGVNLNGATNLPPSLHFDSTSAADSFFGNTYEFNNNTVPFSELHINGLDPIKQYELRVFSSRIASDNRETCFQFNGLTSSVQCVNASSNTSVVVSQILYPDSFGNIFIEVEAGPANNNVYGFFYINALQMVFDSVPVGQPQLHLSSPNGGELWQSGKQTLILWDSDNVGGNVTIDYSADGGQNWNNITHVPVYLQEWQWTVPQGNSNQCLVRLSVPNLSVQSDSFFTITDDSLQCNVVVLGSSTSFGAGASVYDSSWVGRFAAEMYQSNTRFNVVNLAKGGYTTYHVMPDGFQMPSHVTFEQDTLRNITKALTYNPEMIIVNFPSNDAYYYFSASEQMENYRLIRNYCDSLGIVLFVSTSQPRNFSDPTRIQIQYDIRDSVLSVFGNMALNFFDGMADTSGFILQQYDYGDGIHLNDLGHRILYERVMYKNPDALICTLMPVSSQNGNEFSQNVSLYPNPVNDFLSINICCEHFDQIGFFLFDLNGRMVHSKFLHEKSNNLSLAHLSTGVYIYHLRNEKQIVDVGKLLIVR